MIERDLESESRRRLRAAPRVVVKLGTSTVTDDGGEICAERVAPLVRSMSELKSAGRQLVLVSSGAVGLGAGRLGLHRSRLGDLATRQAAAAVGQSLLMHAYEQLFRVHGVPIAQVLLTQDDFKDRQRYGNLRRTMERLLKLNVLPVVNENDTVSTDELEYLTGDPERVFGDNDRLAALVMSKLEASALVLLTNVDGLLLRNGPEDGGGGEADGEESAVVRLVEEITPELKAVAGGASAGGRGGMLTKLEAADIAMRAGGVAVIANGRRADILAQIFAGESIGTTFMSSSRMAGKRRWIAFAAGVRGRLVVNDGAREALLGGKASLLSSGVLRVEEQFEPQSVVAITDASGREFARGIVNCASAEARALVEAGAHAGAREGLSAPHTRVLVTRDNIVLLGE
ncbi:MAG TPA: glutamate 5-kinase [Pyrinomonadaceae bacterium]|nr:glutamate 5-kinase [Pyrinomonadaceae bacterium]